MRLYINRYNFTDPHPPRFSITDIQLLYARKGMIIWKDRKNTIKQLPMELEDMSYFFQINSKGHKNKTYSLEVRNETTIHLAIQENTGEEAKKEVTDFTALLRKDK